MPARPWRTSAMCSTTWPERRRSAGDPAVAGERAHSLLRWRTVNLGFDGRPLRNVVLRLLAPVPAFRRGFAEQLSAIGPR
jgi:hypothetical protein